MIDGAKRLVILHGRHSPPGARHHMVMLISDHLEALGVEVNHLYGTRRFVPADGIFVHVDLSVVPRDISLFAQRYPRQINANACDIRKRAFADGLLQAGDAHAGPVIVKSDLNYGGVPELNQQSRFGRALRRVRRMLTGAPAPKILTKADYCIFPSLADVPASYFTPDNVVQKLILEKDGEKNLLREYMFLGDLHYENIERSAAEIITEDEHISCEPFVPHPLLLRVRRKLGLGYGKIDYVMVDGEPFIFDANKTIGMGSKGGTKGFGDGVERMLKDFAAEIERSLVRSSARPRPVMHAGEDELELPEEPSQSPLGVR